MKEKSDVIATVCAALADDIADSAAAILQQNYPFAPEEVTQRRYGPNESTRVLVRDGFVDRYCGHTQEIK